MKTGEVGESGLRFVSRNSVASPKKLAAARIEERRKVPPVILSRVAPHPQHGSAGGPK